MSRSRLLGYAFGVLTAVCWATSPIFIRKGLEGLPSSLWGVTVGLLAATVVYSLWLLAWRSRRAGQLGEGGAGSRSAHILDPALKLAIGIQVLAGMAAGLGTVGRTLAIQLAPIVVALPLAQTSSLFTLIFAPLILGTKVERVTFKLVVGALLIVLGSALVVVGQNY